MWAHGLDQRFHTVVYGNLRFRTGISGRREEWRVELQHTFLPGRIHQLLKEEIIPIPYNLSQRVEAEENLLTRTLRPPLPRYQKQDRDYKTRKLQASISYERRCTDPPQKVGRSNPTVFKQSCTPEPSGTYSRCAKLVRHLKINGCNPSHQ